MFALLMLAQVATQPPIVTTPVPAPAAPGPTDAQSDARCIVVFGFVGSRATAGEQAEASKRGIVFFLGKLRGRDAAVDIPATITRAAEAARTANVNARSEAERCAGEIDSAGRALAAMRGTMPPTPALRDVPRVPGR